MVIEFTSAFWDSHFILIVSWLNHVKSQFSGLRWLTIPRADFCIPYITQHSPCWWSLHYQAWVEEMSIVSPDFLGQTVLSPNLRWWFWWFWWFWAAGIVIWLFLPSFVAGVVPLFGIWWQVGMVGMVVGALMLPISEWLFHHEKMWFSGVNIFFCWWAWIFWYSSQEGSNPCLEMIWLKWDFGCWNAEDTSWF